MKTARLAARAQKGALAYLFRGILLPTVTNAQDFMRNNGFVKSPPTTEHASSPRRQ
jgi:hypothetical protein